MRPIEVGDVVEAVKDGQGYWKVGDQFICKAIDVRDNGYCTTCNQNCFGILLIGVDIEPIRCIHRPDAYWSGCCFVPIFPSLSEVEREERAPSPTLVCEEL